MLQQQHKLLLLGGRQLASVLDVAIVQLDDGSVLDADTRANCAHVRRNPVRFAVPVLRWVRMLQPRRQLLLLLRHGVGGVQQRPDLQRGDGPVPEPHARPDDPQLRRRRVHFTELLLRRW